MAERVKILPFAIFAIFTLAFVACSSPLLDSQVWWRTSSSELSQDSIAKESGTKDSGTFKSGISSSEDRQIDQQTLAQLGSSRAVLSSMLKASSDSDSGAKIEIKPRKQAPVEVQVAQAFYDEGSLNVKVHLSAKTPLDARNLLVAVSGLNEGQRVEEVVQFLDEVVDTDELDTGSTVALHFALSSYPLTEYQVRCSWGEDAARERLKISPERNPSINKDPSGMPYQEQGQNTERAALKRTIEQDVKQDNGKPEGSVVNDLLQPEQIDSERRVFLSQVDIIGEESDCENSPCDLFFTITAAINNRTSAELNNLNLAVGLYWTSQGQLPRLPESRAGRTADEELIALEELAIAPDGVKKIKVRLDRAVPIVPGGAFVPHLRILNYGQS